MGGVRKPGCIVGCPQPPAQFSPVVLFATDFDSLTLVLGPRALHVCWHRWYSFGSAFLACLLLSYFPWFTVHQSSKSALKIAQVFRSTTRPSIFASIFHSTHLLHRFLSHFLLPNLVSHHTNIYPLLLVSPSCSAINLLILRLPSVE